VIVDDTPGVVVVTAFDAVRREVARQSLIKLIQDGRIHPQKIEEIVRETQREMDQNHHEARVDPEAEEAGVPRPARQADPADGSTLNFRVSYSQNVLRHSIEVAYLTGMMAEQLGLDGNLARRCGFLHDIGKAADHEMEGGHPAIGADLLKRYGEGPEVVHAALGHHDDIRPDYIYTVLTAAADACSAARPGARREIAGPKYIRRLEDLEAIAYGFPGVDQVYAVQAGREVRVIVDPKVDQRPRSRQDWPATSPSRSKTS
jgi:ribonuclease Y